MALAVCMLFDSRTNRLLRELWDRLEGSGIGTLASHTHGRHRPHLSYAVLLEWDLERVQAAVGGLADGGPFEINVQGTLTFPRGRAALAPAIPPDVAVRQARLVEVLRGTGATVHRHYALGRWVPHVSVATRAAGASIAVVVKEVADILPLTARVEEAALIDSSTGETWQLSGIP